MKNTEIIKFSIKMPYRLVFLLAKLQFSRKIMKIIDFCEKYQIFQWNALPSTDIY